MKHGRISRNKHAICVAWYPCAQVSARKAAEARVAELEAVAKTLQERVDAHSTKMSSTPTAEASHRNAIALEQQLR